jgi:hypothetical protein
MDSASRIVCWTFFAVALCAARLPAQVEEPAATVPVFEFHSGFWINLHHFLYQQGRIRRAAGQSRSGPEVRGLASTDGLSDEERNAWYTAVSAYAADWSALDLQLNGDMALINNRLADLENCAELSGKAQPQCESGLRPQFAAALIEAAPIYRAHWWPEQDRENRQWIAAVAPVVRQMGMALAGQLANIYQRDWPAQPIRVDVVWSVGPLGAYTTLNPVHVTMSSDDPRNRGPAAFEVLFHEASHALASGLSQAIIRECRQRNKPIPRNLWHAILYYTTGEMARRIYARTQAQSGEGESQYTPYADRNGLYDHGWGQYKTLLDQYWQPYLDGKGSFDTAIARIVAAL